MDISIRFEPRDLWVGVYWCRWRANAIRVYLCVLPCVPIILTFWRRAPIAAARSSADGWSRSGNETVKGMHHLG